MTTIAEGFVDLKCKVEWLVGEYDNGDRETEGLVTDWGDMPDGMVLAIHDWLLTENGKDWLLTKPHNHKRAAECVGDLARREPNRLRNRQPQ